MPSCQFNIDPGLPVKIRRGEPTVNPLQGLGYDDFAGSDDVYKEPQLS
jgi:hypothetical protein